MLMFNMPCCYSIMNKSVKQNSDGLTKVKRDLTQLQMSENFNRHMLIDTEKIIAGWMYMQTAV